MSSFPTYLKFGLVSLLIHLILFYFLFSLQVKPVATLPKEKSKLIHSYLVTSVKKVEPPPKIELPEKIEQPKEAEQEVTAPIEQGAPAEQRTIENTDLQPDQEQVEEKEENKAEHFKSTNEFVTSVPEENTKTTTSAPTQTIDLDSLTRGYLDSIEGEKMQELMAESFSDLHAPPNLFTGKKSKNKKEILKDLSNSFVPENTGFTVIAETNFNERLIHNNGNCFIVKTNENNESLWTPTSCRGYDPNGELLKEILRKRLNKID